MKTSIMTKSVISIMTIIMVLSLMSITSYAEEKQLTPGEIAAQQQLIAQIAAANAELAAQVAAAAAGKLPATQTDAPAYQFPANAIASITLALYPNESSNQNAKHACDIINGKTIDPGIIFSYNNVLGKRSKKTGFVKAPVVDGIDYGGGICKISTALYNLALDSGFAIVERYSHSHAVPYVAAGKDATVDWNKKDLKFVPTQKVQIIAVYDSTGYHLCLVPAV